MSTDALSLAAWKHDDPWRRLYWTLPAALAIWVALVGMLAFFVRSPGERLPEPTPIEAQVIELPPPPIHNEPQPPTIKRPPPPEPVKPPTPHAPVQVAVPKMTLEQSPPVAEVKPTPIPVTPPPAPALSKPVASTEPERPHTSGAHFTGTSGAQAIVRPMPLIPDELRQDALNVAALARFHVEADGTVTVELVKPTPNPRLNRLLLDALKSWRFFPAMKDGKPAASIEEIVIKVEIK